MMPSVKPVKTEPWINQNPVEMELKKCANVEIFINVTCINLTPVYLEHKSWYNGGSV